MMRAELTHDMLQRYMRSFATFHGVNSIGANPNISYNTRVELAEKDYNGSGNESSWTLTLKRLEKMSENSSRATWSTEVRASSISILKIHPIPYIRHFDAIVIVTGRFNAPSIPWIPGLSE